VGPDRFDVHECPNCDTRFAWPLRARTEVYDQIYACREKLPGYDRYERLRVAIASSADPLQTLAEFEDVYWGVKVALEGVKAQAKARGQGVPRVLELGSGMGYLTHAMRSRGFSAEGWDVSAQAVNQACLAFGPHFRVCDVSGSLESHEVDQLYDAVVATELIEHLEDPQALVRRAAKLLVPGGRLILTAPNREIYPPSMAWHTDAAPVHLWWFSKASMRRMAWAAGMSVSFVDFGPFYGRRGPPVTRATKPQPIDAGGRVIFKDSLVNTIARSLMARWPATSRHIGRVFLRQLSEQSHRERAFQDSMSMCAVLRMPRL
jgi:SAM-dependent methyltransferase